MGLWAGRFWEGILWEVPAISDHLNHLRGFQMGAKVLRNQIVGVD